MFVSAKFNLSKPIVALLTNRNSVDVPKCVSTVNKCGKRINFAFGDIVDLNNFVDPWRQPRLRKGIVTIGVGSHEHWLGVSKHVIGDAFSGTHTIHLNQDICDTLFV